jgi:hypothetical protein
VKPIWLVQINADMDTSAIVAEIKRQCFDILPIEYNDYDSLYITGDIGPQDCVVAYGNIDFVQRVQKHTSFIPGVFCNAYNLKCSTYYAYYGNFLLNRGYSMLPVGDLLNRLAEFSPFFIRPNSSNKSFTGYVVGDKEGHEIQSLIRTIGPETLVVVAPQRSIDAEYRFVVCDRKIIAGTRYLPSESEDYPTLALCLAIKIADLEWQPDLCYTIDIAESDGNMYLLEINSFSSSGLYSCKLAPIIRQVSLVAEEERKQYNIGDD